MHLINSGIYLSSLVDSRGFVIVPMKTTTYIEEYQSGKGNIPSKVFQVLMASGSGASAEAGTVGSYTHQRILSELKH